MAWGWDRRWSIGLYRRFFFTDLFATGVRRSLCRLQLHAVFCEVSVLHAPVQGCSSRTRGKAAGNRGSFVEAGGGKDLAEQGLVAINIGGAGEGKTKETGTEGSGGREGEQGGPMGSEGSNGCRPQRSRHSTGPAASEEANELVRVWALRAPPALRAAAATAWTRRWWGMLPVAVQQAVGGTALGVPWLVSDGASGFEPALDHVLALTEPVRLSRLPLS